MADGSTRSQKTRWSVAPYFVVDDVVASANYYRDKLGFEYDRFWGSLRASAWSPAGESPSC